MTNMNDQAGAGRPRHLPLLRSLLSNVPNQLAGIPPEDAAAKPDSGAWSRKEELGHLIDSAANNHLRVVRAQIEEAPAMPDYDGEAWVEIHGYQLQDWSALVNLWRSGNAQLLAAADSAPPGAWSRTLTVGGSDTLTISFVLDDYVEHMLGHLGHIGLDVDRLRSASADVQYPEKPAQAEYPIHELIRRRWSPRLFEERAVETHDIMTLLEAARWAPSCFNEQPWRYLVFDGRDANALEKARACLVEGNAWALKAPALMLSVARENFARNEAPNRTAQHDVGLASEDLVLQAVASGLAAHQMAGFDADRARREFKIPDGYTPMAMIAIGYPYYGDVEALSENIRARELAPRSRKPIAEIAFAGDWDKPYHT